MKKLIKRFKAWRISRSGSMELYYRKLELEDQVMQINLELSKRTWVNRTEPVIVKEGALWRQHDNQNLPEFKEKVGEI